MADIVNRATRSRMMSGIREKNTVPELTVRRYLHATGLRYRLNVGTLPGKPDLVFPMHRTVVFVHGCFWHRHAGCRYAYVPATRRTFWLAKFAANMERDRDVGRKLRKAGWRVLTIWECRLDERRLAALRASILDASERGAIGKRT